MVGEAVGAVGKANDAAIEKTVSEKGVLHGKIVLMGVGTKGGNPTKTKIETSIGQPLRCPVRG